MDFNFVMLLSAAVVSMIVGSLWYGPFFGKKWMEIIGATDLDREKRKQMQKEAIPLYGIQFVLALIQLTILAFFTGYHKAFTDSSEIATALLMWIGFVMPTVAGSAMWNNNPPKVKWAMFLIQAGYQLILFLIYGYMFGMWG